jgi:hypothetical protein
MGLFGSGTNKATENWLEKREEGETRKIQKLYRDVHGEANAVVKELGVALAHLHHGKDKEAANYLKYGYAAIDSTIRHLDLALREEYRLAQLSQQIARRVPKDKKFELLIRKFAESTKAKTKGMDDAAHKFRKLEHPYIFGRPGLDRQTALKSMHLFQAGIELFHKIGQESAEIVASLDKLYKMELRYLSK